MSQPTFTAKKQRAAGVNQGKWCVYRPDGIRLVVCEDRATAEGIAYGLRVAAAALDDNWHSIAFYWKLRQ